MSRIVTRLGRRLLSWLSGSSSRSNEAGPTVSLIMPVYNGEDLVADAIDSVLVQTYDDVELIVIDDGSTDGTRAVVEDYLPHGSITLLTQDNQGVTATTNRGIRHASGEFLAIHPQDDVSHPDRLERQVRVLRGNPDVGFVYAPAEFVDRQGEVFAEWGDWRGEGRRSGRAVFRKLYVDGMFIASPSVLFRRDHISDDFHPWGDPELRIVSDWEHWMQAARHYDAYEMGEPVVRMLRDDDHENLGRRSEQVFAEERVVLRRLRRRYADGDPPVTRRTYHRAMSNLSMRECRYHLYERGRYAEGVAAAARAFRYDPLNRELYEELGSIVRELV